MTLVAADDGFSDDLPYAKRVAEFLEVPLQIVEVNPSDYCRSEQYGLYLR